MWLVLTSTKVRTSRSLFQFTFLHQKGAFLDAFLMTEPKGTLGLLRGLRGGSKFPPAALTFADQVPQPNGPGAGFRAAKPSLGFLVLVGKKERSRLASKLSFES